MEKKSVTPMSHREIFFAFLATAVITLLALAGSYLWDSSRNRGSDFGYYGEFNRVSNALASIAGVTVTNGWHNHDITLEEFCFDISFSGQPLRLYFGERDPVRSLSREAAIAALQRRIQTQIASSRTNK